MPLYTFRLHLHLDLCVVRLQDASRYNVCLKFQMGALSTDTLLCWMWAERTGRWRSRVHGLLQVGWMSDKSCWPWGSKGITCGTVYEMERTHTNTHTCNHIEYTLEACLHPHGSADLIQTRPDGMTDTHTHAETHANTGARSQTDGDLPPFSVYCNSHVAYCYWVVTICEATSPDGIFCILEKRQQ